MTARPPQGAVSNKVIGRKSKNFTLGDFAQENQRQVNSRLFAYPPPLPSQLILFTAACSTSAEWQSSFATSGTESKCAHQVSHRRP